MKKRNRKLLWLMTVALSLCLLMALTACGSKSAIVGSWRLVESEDPTYTPGITFEFKESGLLNLHPGNAQLSDEDKEMFASLQERLALNYQASPNGDLRLTLDKVDGGSAVLRMKYAIEGDTLTIRDENDVKLTFRKQQS